MKASGNAKVDGSQVHLGMGANSAAESGLSSPDGVKSTEMPQFSGLDVITRSLRAAGLYETPEDGDPTAYRQAAINSGAIKADEVGTTEKTEEVKPDAPPVKPGPQSCAIILGMSSFEPSYSLTKNFTIGSFTQKGKRPLSPQQGLSVALS